MFKPYMIGVHLALLAQLASTSIFGVQAGRALLAQVQGAKNCAVAGRLPAYGTMCASSIVALGAMMQLKPKKKKTLE